MNPQDRVTPGLKFLSAMEDQAAPEVGSNAPHVRKAQVTAALGTLTIIAKPKGLVRLDLADPDAKKSASGSSYENKSAKPGQWRVVARATGYEAQEQTVEVPPDDVTLLKIDLKPLGGLKVLGSPSGASVSVTGPGGFHDEGGLPWEAEGLTSGSYQVKVTRAGYGTDEETAEVQPGATATVKVALQKKGLASAGAGGTKVEPKSGLEFIRLPGGTFHYGCEPQDAECYDNEKPGKSVTVQPFWLGKTDVTVAAYASAEAVWWRCHRRIITDYLLARGMHVEHIMGLGHVLPATLTPGARIMLDGTLRYPAPEGTGAHTSGG